MKRKTVRIEDRIEELIELFRQKTTLSFLKNFLKSDKARIWFIVTFMSVLEMVRLHLITIVQVDQLGAIHCSAHEDFAKNSSDWFHQQNSNENEAEALLKAS